MATRCGVCGETIGLRDRMLTGPMTCGACSRGLQTRETTPPVSLTVDIVERTEPGKQQTMPLRLCSSCGNELGFRDRVGGRETCGACRSAERAVARLRAEEGRVAYSAALEELAGTLPIDDVLTRLQIVRGEYDLDSKTTHRLDRAAVTSYAGALADAADFTPEMEKRLFRAVGALGVGVGDDLRAALLLAAINEGRLPATNSHDLITKPGERVHFVTTASLLDETTTTRYKGGGGGISVPIGLGVRVGTGSYSGRRVSKTSIKTVDRGSLTVTSKRVVFVGSRRTVETPLVKLVSLTAGGDRLQLHTSNRQKGTLLQVPKRELDPLVALVNAAAVRAVS